MSIFCAKRLAVAVVAASWLVFAPRVDAVPFTTSFTAGGNWNAVFGQGFKASIMPSVNPGLLPTDTVRLDRFQFFKSGNADQAANFKLAILDNFFVDLDTLTTQSAQLIGLSTNTINGTSSISTGGSITFNFQNTNVLYGDSETSTDFNYAAIFVTVGTDTGSGAPLTPVLVPALIANYAENPVGSGTYVPTADYGDALADYFLSTTNTITGTAGSGRFFDSFKPYHADANFIASFNQPAGFNGDYNNNGIVDAADYTVWRDNLGKSITLPNDTSPGSVLPIDYDVWKANFGMGSGGSGASMESNAVPEPTTFVPMTMMAMAAASFCNRRKRN